MKADMLFSKLDSDLARKNWFISGAKNKRYPKRPITNPNPPPRQVHVYAHRIVLSRILNRKLTPSDICDHVNGNKHDCRRENLRLVDQFGNSQNVKHNSTTRGTTRHKSGKWQSGVTHKKQFYYLGLFSSRAEAAAVARRKRQELNFLDQN